MEVRRDAYAAGRDRRPGRAARQPADIFSGAETPLLATFTFKRSVPEGETEPPATLAKRQCVTLAKP